MLNRLVNRLAKYFYGICVSVIMPFLFGCSDKPVLQDEVVWKKVCTQWGVSSAKVKEIMRTYSLKQSSSSVLTYKGKSSAEAISYRFVDDSLCAVVVLIDATQVDETAIYNSFNGQESLGENNSAKLFIDYPNMKLIAVSSIKKNDMKYYSVGYADLGNVLKNSEK